MGSYSYVVRVLVLLSISALLSASGLQAVETFEGDRIADSWTVVGAGRLLHCTENYKDGRQSLAWEWSAGDRLIFSDAAAFEGAAGFTAWVHNQAPVQGTLQFRFGVLERLEDGEAPYAFSYPLWFSGWRYIHVHFSQDVPVEQFRGDPVVTTMLVEASAEGSGRLCLDEVDFPATVLWSRGPDRQLPFLNPQQDHDWFPRFDDLALAAEPERSATQAERRDLRRIQDRYRGWLLGEHVDWTDPLVISRYEVFLQRAEQAPEAVAELTSRALLLPEHFREIINRLGILSVAYHMEAPGNSLYHDPAIRETIFSALRHLHEQGWAAGSLFGDPRWFQLSTGGYEPTVFLMRDELKAEGLLEEVLDAVRWYSCIGRVLEEKDHEGMCADTIRGRYLLCLAYVLSLEDVDMQAMWMRHLSAWLSRGLLPAPGWGGTIKPDFTGFHHQMVIGNSYVIDALHAGAAVQYLLHDTGFALSEAATDSLRNALLAARWYANKYDVPTTLALRWPFTTDDFMALMPAYAYLALAEDDPEGEMQRAFLRLWAPDVPKLVQRALPQGPGFSYVGTMGAVQAVIEAARAGGQAEPAPQGFRSFPYGGLAVHRRDNRMVSTKGWSRYITNYEQSRNRNIYGRYTSHGTTLIYGSGDPVCREASGYSEPGWDWNRWPGTTAIYLPWQELYGKSEAGDPCPWGRLRNEETFVGAVEHRGMHGMFAMKLSDPHNAPGFHARKSYLYVDNTVICLGSGIVNDDAEHPVETVLFQLGLPEENIPTHIRGVGPTSAFPLEWHPEGGAPVWLVDHVGNGYFVPHPAQLRVVHQRQHTPWHGSLEPNTEGIFEVAWLAHGVAPEGDGYEYVIRIQTSPEEMEAYAQEPDYQVLSRNNRAHIVRHLATNITGYALFEGGDVPDDDLVRSVDTPCLLMAHLSGDRCILSVCDPDLGWTDEVQRSPVKMVKVTLEGNWRLEQTDEARLLRTEGGRTILEFTCGDGKTAEVELMSGKPRG